MTTASIPVFDVLLRTAAVTQLLFTAWLLWQRAPALRVSRCAVALPLGLAAFLVTSAPGWQPHDALGWLLTVVCVANPVWLWLVAQALFDDRFALRPVHAAALAVMIAAGLVHERTSLGAAGTAFDLAWRAAVLGFALAAVWHVARERAADLDEVRRRWRRVFVIGAGAYVATCVVLQLVFAGVLPVALQRLHVVLIGALALVAAGRLALWRASAPPDGAGAHEPPREPPPAHAARPAAVPAPPTAPPRRVVPVSEALVARVRQAMVQQRLYRDEHLTVAGLARALGSQEYLVRRAINRGLGYRNFNDFLHEYRLAEVTERLRREPALPVLTIALDAGYGSLGPFNRAFRARFGMTPSAYRAAAAALEPGAASDYAAGAAGASGGFVAVESPALRSKTA